MKIRCFSFNRFIISALNDLETTLLYWVRLCNIRPCACAALPWRKRDRIEMEYKLTRIASGLVMKRRFAFDSHPFSKVRYLFELTIVFQLCAVGDIWVDK